MKKNIFFQAGGRSTHLVFNLSDVIVVNHDGGFLHPTAPSTQGAQI